MVVKSHRFTFIKKNNETNTILSNTFILLEHPIHDVQHFLSMRSVQTSLNLYKKLHTWLRTT